MRAVLLPFGDAVALNDGLSTSFHTPDGMELLMQAGDRAEANAGCAFEERHFTIPELAQMWNLSEEFIRQLVRDEPGVTEWVRQAPGKRRYRVLRIPQSVADRLYRRAQERGANGACANLVRQQRRSRR